MSRSRLIGLCIAAAFVAAPATVQAASLKIVDVTAPDINCVFDPSCKLPVTDSIGDIVIPGVTGKATLQSRTFSGTAGAPGDGLTGYEYRVDLRQASIEGEAAGCVTDMTVDFGPVTQLQYNKAGADDDVYVVTKGGLGSIGLLFADFVDNKITFVFERPVCPTSESNKGESSYFFGLAAKGVPTATMVSVSVSALLPQDVKGRSPIH